jgi:mannitol/fructose-specific phosphotransferase system IIA component (Ntr-type)
MEPSTRTPEEEPNYCPVCRHWVQIEPSRPPGDAPCPQCGHLLWFAQASPIERLDCVGPEAVIRRMHARDKLAAITALANRLHATGKLPQDAVAEVITAMARREELGSTGIGRGLAVPHTKHPSVSHVIGAIGYSQSGIDFNSLDGQLVHTVVMLVSPPDRPGEYLRALEQVSKLARSG